MFPTSPTTALEALGRPRPGGLAAVEVAAPVVHRHLLTERAPPRPGTAARQTEQIAPRITVLEPPPLGSVVRFFHRPRPLSCHGPSMKSRRGPCRLHPVGRPLTVHVAALTPYRSGSHPSIGNSPAVCRPTATGVWSPLVRPEAGSTQDAARLPVTPGAASSCTQSEGGCEREHRQPSAQMRVLELLGMRKSFVTVSRLF